MSLHLLLIVPSSPLRYLLISSSSASQVITTTAYLIATCFFSVYEMAIDTLFLCFLQVSPTAVNFELLKSPKSSRRLYKCAMYNVHNSLVSIIIYLWKKLSSSSGSGDKWRLSRKALLHVPGRINFSLSIGLKWSFYKCGCISQDMMRILSVKNKKKGE